MSGRIRIRRRRRHSQISDLNHNGSHIFSNSSQTPLHTSDYIDFNDEALFNSILDRIANQHHEQYRKTQLFSTSKSFFSSIPIIEITGSLLKSGSISCSICKDDYVINDKVIQLPCNHVFHHDCIVPWLNRSNSCPLCRFKLPGASVNSEDMVLSSLAAEREVHVDAGASGFTNGGVSEMLDEDGDTVMLDA